MATPPTRSELEDLSETLQLSLKIVGKIHPSVPAVANSAILAQPSLAPVVTQTDIIADAFTKFVQFYDQLIRNSLIPSWEAEAKDTEAQHVAKSQSRARLRVRSLGLDPATNLLTSAALAPESGSSGWSATLSVKTMDIASQIIVALYSHFKISAQTDKPVSISTLATSSPPVTPPATTNPKLAAILAQQALQAGTAPSALLPAGSSRGVVDIPSWLQTVWDAATSTKHPLASVLAIRTFVNLLTLPPNSSMTPVMQNGIVTETKMCHKIAHRLWDLLNPALSIVHYQAAGLFSDLRDFAPEVCEEVVSAELITPSLEQRVQGLQRFALLWRLTGELSASSVGNSVNSTPFTKNLFQMLDTLNDEQPMAKLAGRTWLADSISKIERILDPLFVVLLDKNTARSDGFYAVEYDCRRVLYVFKILQWIIECDFRSFMQYVMEKPISKDIIGLAERQNQSNGSSSPMSALLAYFFWDSHKPLADENTESLPSKPKNYLDLLVIMSLRYISGQVSPKANPEFISKNSVVQTTSANFLQYLLQKVTVEKTAAELAFLVQEPVLQNLAQAVSLGNLILQAQLLGLLRTIILIDFGRFTSTAGASSAPHPHLLAGTSPPSHSSSPSTKELASSFVALENSQDSIGKSPMFLQTIIIGLLQPNTDFNIRFYWLEFVTSCLPSLSKYLGTLVPPLIKCICDVINSQDAFYDSVGSKDTMMLLRALNFIISFLLSGLDQDKKSRDTAAPQSGGGSNVVSSFFRGIFQQGDAGESPPPSAAAVASPTVEAVSALLQKLPVVVEALIRVWGPPSIGHGKVSKGLGLVVEFSSDETHNRYGLQDQVLHVRIIRNNLVLKKVLLALFQIMELLYTNFPTRLLTSAMYLWRFNVADSITGDFGPASANLPPTPNAVQISKLTVLEFLNAMSNVSSDSVFKSITDIVKTLHAEDARKLNLASNHSRASSSHTSVLTPALVQASTTPPSGGSSDAAAALAGTRRGRPSTTVHNQDSIVTDFLAFFCEFGTKPVTETGCSHLFAASRELLSTHNPHAVLLLFRAIDHYLSKTPKATLRKFKREYQEIAQKVVDSSLNIAMRTFVDYSASWRVEARFFLSQDDPNINVGSNLPGSKSMNQVGLPSAAEESNSESSSESGEGTLRAPSSNMT